MTITALNRTQGRAADHGGMFTNGVDLDCADAQPILKRIGESLCPFSVVDRVAHTRLVAAVALDAKRHPKSPFAKATLA